MYKYEIILYWSAEDESYIAEEPDCQAAWRMVKQCQKHLKIFML